MEVYVHCVVIQPQTFSNPQMVLPNRHSGSQFTLINLKDNPYLTRKPDIDTLLWTLQGQFLYRPRELDPGEIKKEQLIGFDSTGPLGY